MYLDPEELRNMSQYKPQTPDEWANLARCYANSVTTKAMAELQVFRGVELRRNRTEINLHISRNCEAALAYSRGHVVRDSQACQSCRRGCGPFNECVVMSGYLKGSCSNCHYNGEGSHCSFRLNTNAVVPALNVPLLEEEIRGDNEILGNPIAGEELTNSSSRMVNEAHQISLSNAQLVANADRNWIAQNAHKAATRRRLAIVLNQMADLSEVESDLFNELIE